MAVAVMTMTARDRLYINDFSINAGQSKTIEVILDNDTVYCAMQFDITLPEGLTIDMDGDEHIIDPTERKARDHVVSTNTLESGAIRVFVTSQNSRPFSGNSGAILTIDITASDSFAKGDVKLSNSVLVEENGKRHLLADETAKVNGGTPVGITGDLNGDGNVNTGDVSVLYAAILSGSTDTLYDHNGDGNVNSGDVSALYTIILGN